MNDKSLESILASAAKMGIGLQSRKYEGDLADLLAAGRTDFSPAVALTIYFDGPRQRFADGVVACWAEFLEAFGDRLTWYSDEDLGKWRPATAKRLQRPSTRLANDKPMPFYAWIAVSGDRFEHASPVTFTATVRDGAGAHLSFVRATFPVDAVASEAAIQEFVATMSRWCERLPFLHGYGGLTVNQSPHESQPNSGLLLQIAERFAGLEIDDCGGTVLVARDFIKGVNWLTLLGQPFVERVGGRSALRARLSPVVGIHDLSPAGVIVQAGPSPTRGDPARGDNLEPYREVARTLRPICLETHPPLGPAEFGSFGHEKTRSWLRRFDEQVHAEQGSG